MHCFFSGTCFQTLGSARSTRALAFSRPKPKRLLTISPAPFLFQPGLLTRGSNSDVQTTKCCRSRQVRSGLELNKTEHAFNLYLRNTLLKKNFFFKTNAIHATDEANKNDILLLQSQGKYPSSQWGRRRRASVRLCAFVVQICTSLQEIVFKKWAYSLWTKGLFWTSVDFYIHHENLSKSEKREWTNEVHETHYSLVGVVSAAVGRGQRRGAFLGVPRGKTLLGGTADRDGVDAVCVSVTITVVALTPTITRRPHENRAFPTTPLE